MRARAAFAPDHIPARARDSVHQFGACPHARLDTTTRAGAMRTCLAPFSPTPPDKGGIPTMAQATKTTLRPLHDHVMVQRREEDQPRHGSIIIPDSAKE